MPYKTALIVLLLFFFHESWGDPGAHVFRNQCVFVDSLATGNSELTSCDQEFVGYQRPSPLLKAFRLKQQQNKKNHRYPISVPIAIWYRWPPPHLPGFGTLCAGGVHRQFGAACSACCLLLTSACC